MINEHKDSHCYDVIIVGGGAAGVGVGAVLKQLGLSDFLILDKDQVASTFKKWTKEMRLLTPSFPGHGFGLLDLNAIVPNTSPGYSFKSEHLSGEDYATYISKVAEHFELPIEEKVEVKSVDKKKDTFFVQTNEGTYKSLFIIWAAGEFHYPNSQPFSGAQHCLHTSQISSWENCKEDHYFIIGGSESGVDAAIQLSSQGIPSTILTKTPTWQNDDPDPSKSLSPFTLDRLKRAPSLIRLIDNSKTLRVIGEDDGFSIELSNGKQVHTKTPPLLATGYRTSLSLLPDKFVWDSENKLQLTERDESTVTEGLFLVGPQVEHRDVIFCFIYKFRQRFAIVAEEICIRLGHPVNEEVMAEYEDAGMYLDDLSCCDDSCIC
ncbi:NAD(P)/FAD-dependent oxidoreductase [Salipaludibacillus sp. HK11]|uniref:NAD(P)/FAD-dependent oxidoreductase n=1 Tax=Salipaludibacillus sp. HK11 TaxID=3394320 RepID=UPI0039FDDBE1